MSEQLNAPVVIQVLTNLNCNLACDYCYERKSDKVNDIDSIRQYLRHKFKDSYGRDRTVDIIGGESLMYPPMVEAILEESLRLTKEFKGSFVASIASNGTLLHLPEVRALLEKYKCHIHIGISVDGGKDLHDRHRKYADGRGSYDSVIANLPWALDLFKGRIGVKATFSVDSFIESFADSIIHLIGLGFTDIAGNVVYEDATTQEHVEGIYKQLIKVIDYVYDNELQDTVVIRKITENYLNNSLLLDKRDLEYCGSCSSMTCLGFDKLIYGCTRFCTMDKPDMEIGLLEDAGIKITNQPLIDTICTTRHRVPQECRDCSIQNLCPSCLAAPYETSDTQAYLNEKRSCGWTHALALALMYLRSKSRMAQI